MDLGTLEFRAEWFKDKETKLQNAAVELECLSQKIGAVKYDWSDDYRFKPLKPAYDTMVAALTSGPGGCREGVILLKSLRDAVVTTARAYLRTEAANADLAAEVERIIDDLDL